MGVWSYNFVEAQTHDGRKLRLMTLIDEFTRSPPFGASTNLTIPCRPGAAVWAGHSQFGGGQGGEFGELHCKLGHAVQIGPVSGRGLPKTGIFQISAGDYRLFRSGHCQIWSLETGPQFAKARHWWAFCDVLG